MEKPAACFARNMGTITEAQQRKLQKARIAVFGLGGVGGIAAELLVRAGVGHLMVIDFDKFEITNFNRQIHAQKETMGRKKADVFEKKAKSINPKIEIKKISKKLEYKTMELFSASLASFAPHIVVDTTDSACSRVMLARICRKMRAPYLYSAAMGARGMVGMLDGKKDLERVLHLPSYGLPDSQVEPSLVHYPQCKTAWGSATNLVGVLAANAALNFRLKKPYPRAPKFWLLDAFSERIVQEERLA